MGWELDTALLVHKSPLPHEYLHYKCTASKQTVSQLYDNSPKQSRIVYVAVLLSPATTNRLCP